MTILDLRGFDLTPNKITFESVVDQEQPDGTKLPRIKVGYKGKLVANLYEWMDEEPSSEGCTKGQWWAMAYTPQNKDYQDAINKMMPMGQTLEELKVSVSKIIKQHF